MFKRQVKYVFNQNILRSLFRNSHVGSNSSILYRLDNKSLLRVKGTVSDINEASGFLQGLITNDMRHFDDGKPCIYAMFLNTKGRVLYDTLVHRTTEKDTFLLECDKAVLKDLKKHLTIYKLRKKINIDVSSELKLYSLISDNPKSCDDYEIHKDPRMPALGHRVITSVDTKEDELIEKLGDNISVKESDDYKYLRYQLGVGEGIDDLPPGSCIPLEANCDYLHGVSFHKGCYIGQELTARVYHTGVVRRRFMPLKFDAAPTEQLPKDTIITASDAKTKIGKLKGVMKDYGLGLVNIAEALQAKSLQVLGCTGKVEKPSWWPIEASKEKAGAAKTSS